MFADDIMPGAVTLSVELELGWGMHDKGRYNHLSSDAQAEFDALSFFIDICDEHEIPISFDIVGHLLHESCSETHPGPYPDGWWDADPNTDYRTDPLFYAPDFVSEITSAETRHEVCTHTYSHVLAEEMSDAVLDHELTTVARLHQAHDLGKPRSIVMPRHQQPSYELLNSHGIETIRTPFPEHETPGWKERLGSVGTLLWFLTRRHPSTELVRSDGVLKTHCTPYPSLTSPLFPTGQLSVHPAIRLIPKEVRWRVHEQYLKRAIDIAATKGEHVHLWTHLYNMADQDQHRGIKRGLEHLAKQRDDGNVIIKRMCDLQLTDA